MGLYSSPVISVHWGKCLQPEVPGVSQVIKFNAPQSVSFSNKGSDGYIGQLYNVVKAGDNDLCMLGIFTMLLPQLSGGFFAV